MNLIEQMLKPEILWTLSGLLLLIAEFALPGLIIFFFGLGALITALVCVIAEIPLNSQLLVFLVSSVVMLVALRRWIKGLFWGHERHKQALTENIDSFSGETATVTQTITPAARGKVEFHGASWAATADTTIEAGSLVSIVSQDSLTLKVESH